MNNYKAQTTLNEKDSLYDVLSVEKNLVKLYATAITEGCSKGFRVAIKNNLIQAISDQLSVFLLVTEADYERVESATEAQTKQLREKFSTAKKEIKKKKPT